MNRITEIEIAGKKYPLNFSLKAAKKLAEKYGDIQNIGDALNTQNTSQQMETATFMLYILIDQGCAYKRIMEEEDIKAPTLEELEIIVGVADFANISQTLMDAMTAGMKPTIETEPEEPKNAKATQE